MKDAYVVGKKVTKNGCKMAKLKSCHFFLLASLYDPQSAGMNMQSTQSTTTSMRLTLTETQ